MWHMTIVTTRQKEIHDRWRVTYTKENSAPMEQERKWNGTDAEKG